MTCDPRTSQALIDALFRSASMGLCLFDLDGKVVALEGAAAFWAPPIGSSIDQANIFVGLSETFKALRASGESLELSGLSIGSDDARALDVRILWIEALGLFAALSHTATERNQLQFQVAQFVRDNRLLEQKIREQQEKIAEQAALMELFIRHTPAAVAMLDSRLSLMMLSQRWIEEFGDPSLIDDPEVPGSPLRIPQIQAALRLALDTGVTSSRVEKIFRRGSIVWKRWEQTPWRRADRSIGGTILFFEDVTDEIRKSVDLHTRTSEVQKLNASMRTFSEAVTGKIHAQLKDARQAARIVTGASARNLDRATARAISALEASLDALDGKLTALQRYFQIAAYDFVLTPFDLAEAVERAAAQMQDAIRAAGARINLHPMLSVTGDLALMTRVFRNLIDNALKHAGGAPVINIDCLDEDGVATVRFTDDGPGIPAHLHTRAFELFGRIDVQDGTHGEGMGLPESRKIVELHGGTMVIDPGYDLGLRVLINLPQNAPARRTQMHAAP